MDVFDNALSTYKMMLEQVQSRRIEGNRVLIILMRVENRTPTTTLEEIYGK